MNKLSLVFSLLALLSLLAGGCRDAYDAALAEAVRHSDIQVAQRRLASGAGINDPWFGQTPMHVAAREANQEMLQFLLDRGADVNSLSAEKKTPLDYAVARKDGKALVGLLKSQGAKRAKEILK